MVRVFALVIGVALLMFSTENSDAKVVIKESTKYYNVRGKKAISVYKQMSRRGPKIRGLKHVVASTNVTIKAARFKGGIKGRKCVTKSFSIRLSLKYTYPRWKNVNRASKGDRRRWNAYFKEIVRHEKRHGAIAKKYVRDIDRTIRATTGRASRKCAGMASRMKTKITRLKRNYDRAQVKFDRREYRRSSKIMKLARKFATSK